MKRKNIESELERECAHERFNERNYGVMTNLDRTFQFHVAMGLPVRTEPAIPSVEERILRAKLLLEETMETIEKGLGVRLLVRPQSNMGVGLKVTCADLEFYEGGKYDPIETLDGLADVKVIANGTAVQFGLPLNEAEYEVFCSNMTKLDENGKPIINNLTPGYRRSDTDMEGTFWCDIRDPDEPGYDSTQPDGKLLKPDTYVPANIARIFVEFAGDGDQPLNRAWLLGQGES